MDYYVNRELSFLKFNRRVLEEAADSSVPLFERLKFISIFHSNLDEFYMIRVGSLYEKSLLKGDSVNDNKTGWSPDRQLKEIFKETKVLYKESGSIFARVSGLLAGQGVRMCGFGELDKAERKWVGAYFRREIMPLLSPQVIDSKHPFPHLLDKQIYIILELSHDGKGAYGIISQNKNISRVVELPGSGGLKYILAEDIIYSCAKQLFKKYRILSKFIIRVTRNADLNAEEKFDDGYDGLDFRSYMNKILKKRGKLAPVRLEMSGGNKGKLRPVREYLCGKLNIREEQAFALSTPLDMGFIFGLEGRVGQGLLYAPIEPEHMQGSIMGTVEGGRDIFLHYPRHSIRAYIKLLEECVADPDVLSVKITLYRLGAGSQVIGCLCRLAEAGKQVTAVVELNARFDEENNINWSKRLEESGCTLVYGVEGYKVHSKITLVTKKRAGGVDYITHFATGNYNEKTAKLYTDTGIITSSESIGKDALKFFNSVGTGDPSDDYSCLLAAPLHFKSEIIRFIGEQAEKAGRIRLKMNSLTDREIIEALVSASQAGAKIELIIRGICCLLPGIAGKTENITVRNIVGRFLEHSRIFIFGEGRESRIYISSADLMTRNTTRRFEIAAPVLDPGIKAELEHIFALYMRDNAKARELTPSGEYVPVAGVPDDYINAQELLFVE